MHLIQLLEYTLPSLIGAQVRAIAAPRKEALIAVDLGCGTGLCGAEIASFVRHLAGVDISPGMLDHADRRGIHHDLVEGDIERYWSGLDSVPIDLLEAAQSGLTPYRAEKIDLQPGLGYQAPGKLFTFRKRSGDGLIHDER